VTPEPEVATFPGVVLIDDREKAPYPFTGFRADACQHRLPLVVPTRRQRLASGDHSVLGLERCVAVERKSLADLFNTIGQRREAFHEELRRLNHMPRAAVVVEATWEQVLQSPPPESRLPPKAVFRAVLAWQQTFRGVHWWFLGSRRLSETATDLRLYIYLRRTPRRII
jgi:ERCC4-type nuclease